ncbi:hypothetical protein FAZ95_38300 [Trinickia violacea]|uniref:Uncharacterized protein n=1 Tax=Trinickia violacea TaxID=2571746 RepID=A0A4P8J423_9BURK|nr:hypothetical protein [Trinickia violacea]QCP54714.1 hypothetical protein FAZ95_38300 [Trinickia violacea]
MHGKEKSTKVTNVQLTRYGNAFTNFAVHDELDQLINMPGAIKATRETNIVADRCTVIISVPKNWGGSFGEHPGHCGIVLWKSNTRQYQSFGILMDGSFMDEEVNVHNDTLKRDTAFGIWYFTVAINPATYERMRSRMETLGVKKVGYGKFFVARGWSEEGSYSCVTAVDTILCAGGLSRGIASMSSTPYAYAQTFTTIGWYVSYADNMKHM